MEEHDKLSKLTMWSKIKEFISDGLNYSEISRRLEIDRHTVSLYASMSYDEFLSSQSYNRLYSRKAVRSTRIPKRQESKRLLLLSIPVAGNVLFFVS